MQSHLRIYITSAVLQAFYLGQKTGHDPAQDPLVLEPLLTHTFEKIEALLDREGGPPVSVPVPAPQSISLNANVKPQNISTNANIELAYETPRPDECSQ